MNDNKTIKVLRILTLSLTLMLLVFALAKKVGLCASDNTGFYLPYTCSYSKLPAYAADIDDVEALVLNYINSEMNTSISSLDDFNGYILGRYSEDNGVQYFTYAIWGSIPAFYLECDSSAVSISTANSMNSSSNRVYLTSVNGNSFYYYRVVYDNNVLSSNLIDTYSSLTLPVPSSTYPYFYCNKPIVYTDIVFGSPSPDPNAIIFSMQSGSGSGTDSPGFSSAFNDAYQEWLDDNSNPVDTNPPTNSSSIPSWLHSILNGLGTLNNTIGGGFATIFNKLKDFSSGVFDFFNDKVVPFFEGITDVTEDIKDILSGSLESDNDIYQAWVDGYEDSIFYDLSNIVSSCKNILTSIFNASTPSTLSFTIPTYPINIPTASGSTNYVYLFGQSLTFDFSWYRSPIFGGRSIYDMVNSVFFTFLYVGFLAALFFKVPSLIHGSSGFSRAMHGDYNLSMGNASGTPSNSKYDFAAMTQFILDN